jgi:hypothetical protein
MYEYMPALLRLAEEPDLLQREWKTDLFKWEWLDDETFVKVFDVEAVLTYWLKIEMMNRWNSLDKASGDSMFRQMVGAMKKGSNHILEEFKRNNKK